MHKVATIAGTLLFGAIGACSNSLVGEGYRGEPIFQIEGRIVDFDGTGPDVSGATASLFWSKTGEATSKAEDLVQQRSVAVGIDFPSTFSINVFERPVLSQFERSSFLVGVILLHEDRNGDGEYSDDELEGGAFDSVVLYAEERLEASESPARLALPQGYSVIGLPLPCDSDPPVFSGEDCMVPLGAPCDSDSECGEGQCLNTDGASIYEGGYCVLSQSASCVPEGGALIDLVNPLGDTIELVWGKGCYSDSDCRDENYTCAAELAACIPVAPVAMYVSRSYGFPSLCNREIGER